MRSLLIALASALALSSASPAHAVTIRATSTAAEVTHPGAYTEWFTLRAVDPSGARTLWIQVHAQLPALDVRLREGTKAWRDYAAPAETDRRPHTGPGVTHEHASLRSAAGGWRLTYSHGLSSGDLRLRGRAAIVAGPWKLGIEPDYEAGTRPRGLLNWSLPVGAGTLDGAVQVETRRVVVRGWRASLDHVWGRFRMIAGSWQHWDTHTAFGRVGEAWLVNGLEPVVLRPGAAWPFKGRDRTWQGVLVRVSGGRAVACNARVRRRGWFVAYPLASSPAWFPETVTASCGGRSATFARVRSTWYPHPWIGFSHGLSTLPRRNGFHEHLVPDP